MKELYVKDMKAGTNAKVSLMIMKKLYRDNNNNTIAYAGDNTGDIKSTIPDKEDILKIGDVIIAEGVVGNIFDITSLEKIENFNMEDYLSTVKRPIDDIMKEIEDISKEEFKSKEILALNDYFFRNEEFLEKFKKGIGGVSQHHNYRGGLAEHTLNVMYMAKSMAYRYDCRNKEIAILGAKLHDIGKIYELFADGPFSYTLKGEMEGHIVIGVTMLMEAFDAQHELYSEDFKERMVGCIVQHHGKVEFGSPKQPNTEEAYIVHYADYIDASLNKISQIKEGMTPCTWSGYERKIEGKLYF
ncbi:3'-5' exoribonuclease YhaM [Clostridium liquoris]|jgi:3'-5' exoribonuclease|uniref:3'-5' exoribonuclease YhaM n=1 Tax=Clostridium liquoris TaxID=1289519 RepID=A0A2T0B1V8_9CLOT|nr:HD domain-containing protein [Clostridium liquoris]PRR77777.1 3'-5' exoribonuclease YhaM [Clostridium liquoris]